MTRRPPTRTPEGGNVTLSKTLGVGAVPLEVLVYDDAVELRIPATEVPKLATLLMAPEDCERLEKMLRMARRNMPAPEPEIPPEALEALGLDPTAPPRRRRRAQR